MYLAYPVTLNGVGTRNGRTIHMTLKYLGDDFDLAKHWVELSTILRGHDVHQIDLVRDKPVFRPMMWLNPDGSELGVLELTNPPERLVRAHAALAHFRQDDYPAFRPHITVGAQYIKAMQAGAVKGGIIEHGKLALMGIT